jgi:hypothetical protein
MYRCAFCGEGLDPETLDRLAVVMERSQIAVWREGIGLPARPVFRCTACSTDPEHCLAAVRARSSEDITEVMDENTRLWHEAHQT